MNTHKKQGEGLKLRGVVRLPAFEEALRAWWQAENAGNRVPRVRDVLYAAATGRQLESLDVYLREHGHSEGLQADDFCTIIGTRRYGGFGRCTFYFDDPQGRAAGHIMDFVESKDLRFSPAILASAVRYAGPPALKEIFRPGYWAAAPEALADVYQALHRNFPSAPALKVVENLMTRLADPDKSMLVEAPDLRGRRMFVDVSGSVASLSEGLMALLRRRLDPKGDSTAILDFGAPQTRGFTAYQRCVFDAINRARESQDDVHGVFEDILGKVRALSAKRAERGCDESVAGKLLGMFNNPRQAIKALGRAVDRLEESLPARIDSARRVADDMERAGLRFEMFCGYFNACSKALETVGVALEARASSTSEAQTLKDLAERYEDLSRMAQVSAGAHLTAKTIADRHREAAIALARLQAQGLARLRMTLSRLQSDNDADRSSPMAELLKGIEGMAAAGQKSLGEIQDSWNDAAATFMTFAPKAPSKSKIPPPLKIWLPAP